LDWIDELFDEQPESAKQNYALMLLETANLSWSERESLERNLFTLDNVALDELINYLWHNQLTAGLHYPIHKQSDIVKFIKSIL